MSRPAFTRVLFAILLGALAAASGCGGGDDNNNNPTAPAITTIPDSWGGVWSVHVVVSVCNTTVPVLDTTVVDTLCPGLPVSELLGLVDSTFCNDAVLRGTETSVSFSCNETLGDPSCTLAIGVTMNGTFNPTAGTSTTTGRINVNASPDGAECFDVCLDVRADGTRTGPTPASCPTPSPGAVRRALAGRSILDLARP